MENETADRIRNLRNRLGMTQAEFARKMGASKRTVEAWEQGRRKPERYFEGRLTMIENEISKMEGENEKI